MTTPKTEKPLTIVRLTASNVMRLKAGIEIVPKGNVVTLSGENKQGKSSVMNCILFAMGGKKELPAKPVREGAAAADVHIDLDELVIDWRCTAAGTVSLIVRPKDGPGVKSPQTVLDSLWNKMCDPVKFVRLSETPEGCRKQAEILRQIVKLDFTALDDERKSIYDEREGLGRDLKNYKGQVSGLVFHADAPDSEVSTSDLITNLNEANEKNDATRKESSKISDMEREREQDLKRVAEITEEIKELERQLEIKRTSRKVREDNADALHSQIQEQRKVVAALPWINTDELQEKIAGADGVNAKVRANKSRREAEEKVRTTQERIDVLTNQITEIDEEKKDKLAKTSFPVSGLGFSADGITLDGLPFSQGSQAEQLVCATAIGLALKPRIRVVLLREASLIDANTRKQLAIIAEADGAQIWEEVVESEDPSAIVIEDGQVK